MKLSKLPEDLPIEAVENVTSLLATLIATLKSGEIFLDAHNINDYNETLNCLEEDIDECVNMYNAWQKEPNAAQYESALARMHTFIIEADALVRQANVDTIH